MDRNDELIELVRENKELYDKTDNNYKNIPMKNDIWRDIALTLNFESGDVAKKEWKVLRGGYREAKKRQICRSGSSRKAVRSWRYLENMRFLDDFNKVRDHASNLTDPHDDETQSVNQYAEQAADELPETSDLGLGDTSTGSVTDTPDNTSSSTSRSSRSKRLKTNVEEEILKLIKTNQADRQKYSAASTSNESQTQNSELKSFFSNMYETTVKLGRSRQRKIKYQISELVLKMEEEEELEKEMLAFVVEYQS